MTDMHTKLRLELIIERPAVRRAEAILQEAGVIGWTVLPALSGFGGKTRWSRGTDISGASDMVMLVSVGGKERMMAAMDPLHSLLDRHIGVLSLTEVQVLRPGRF